MPPKGKTSKKRARSPSGVKVDSKKTQAATRSSKRLKKDAPDTSAVAADEPKVQENVVETAKTADTDTKRGKKTAPAPAPAPVPVPAPVSVPAPTPTPAPASAPPSFSGSFDLYAMNLPSLNSVFSPSRDYAALLAALRKHQPQPDDDDDDDDNNNNNNDDDDDDDTLPETRIFLPAGLTLDSDGDREKEEEPPCGKFRSEAIRDPVAHTTWAIALEGLELVDGVEFGAFEQAGEEDVFYSRPDPQPEPEPEDEDEDEDEDGDECKSAPKPNFRTLGVIADVALADRWHRGVKKAGGVFEMRRAWVGGEDGADEVFEGFFYFEVDYSGYYRNKRPEDGWEVKMPFWAVRARVGEDGEDGFGDEDEEGEEEGGFGSWGGRGRGRRGFGMCQYDFGCY